ncbi:hypothetical protein BHM03_00015746 [Ensete ventricosum]|uniref:Leucine-rich repeat-containing N-terminal plant-type domain-containing protein n=1 Tax=Ensete ventricosum TaxID=4639 RepID=A0A445MER5_ENSVE|nr:hypothetical protein BHM03_00015746 [Ensete ventricosum]
MHLLDCDPLPLQSPLHPSGSSNVVLHTAQLGPPCLYGKCFYACLSRSDTTLGDAGGGANRRGGRPLAEWLPAGKGSHRLRRGSSGDGEAVKFSSCPALPVQFPSCPARLVRFSSCPLDQSSIRATLLDHSNSRATLLGQFSSRAAPLGQSSSRAALLSQSSSQVALLGQSGSRATVLYQSSSQAILSTIVVGCRSPSLPLTPPKVQLRSSRLNRTHRVELQSHGAQQIYFAGSRRNIVIALRVAAVELLLLRMAMQLPRVLTSHVCFHHILLLLLLHPLLLSRSASATETDRLALLAFRAAITKDPSGILHSWNNSRHFCRWPGVACHDPHRGERVTTLALESMSLRGVISPSIGNLTYLGYLLLSNNNFYGEIPPEISRLAQLKDLNLSYNALSGTIPVSVDLCTNLLGIDFTGNLVSGNIPAQLGSLLKLLVLNLGVNKLVGDITPFLGNLSSLKQLDLSSNKLTGEIPSSLGDMTDADLTAKSSRPGAHLTTSTAGVAGSATAWHRTADLAQLRSATPTCRRTPHHQYDRHGERRGSMVSHECSKVVRYEQPTAPTIKAPAPTQGGRMAKKTTKLI